MTLYKRCRAPIVAPVEPVSYAPLVTSLWHVNSQNNVGNALLLTISASQIMNHYAAQSAAANGDEFFTQSFWLKDGVSYVVDAYCVRGGTAGILKLDFMKDDDDTQLATVTQDLYNSVAVFNFKVQLGYIPGTDVLVYLRGKANGKNAASSSYVLPITCFMVRS